MTRNEKTFIVMFALGFGLIERGVWMWNVPLAYVVGGLFLVAFSAAILKG